MAWPCPQPAARPPRPMIQSHFVRIESLLVDRKRRRHRDTALVRERIGVRPEADVEPEPAEPQPPAPAQLDPLALVARDPAAHHPRTDPLLPADVHRGAEPGVPDVGTERRPADRV